MLLFYCYHVVNLSGIEVAFSCTFHLLLLVVLPLMKPL
uniref:Uncharacterized protein n=1 Tax=Rhizophora mucronata TaxID=61149 RepID=A0A2P2PSP0_RHIMU